MQKGLLPDLLKTLTQKEKKAFQDYLNSPFFNKKQEATRLAEHLLNPEAAPESKKKDAAFPLIFGEENAFDDARMRKAMEHLLRLLEHFLVVSSREKEGFETRLRLARILADRKQERLFKRIAEMPLPFPENENDWTADDFDRAGQWFKMLYDYRSANFKEHDPALHQKITRCENIALLARRLKTACIFRSNQKANPGPPDPLLANAETLFSGEDFLELPLLKTLFAAYKTLNLPENTDAFAQFRDGLLRAPVSRTPILQNRGAGSAILQNRTTFSPEERRELLLVAINFCSKRYNAGDVSLLDDHLELYRHGLREGLLLENGWISGTTFTNIATLALIGQRLVWLEDFLKDFSEKIALRDRREVAAFNWARLHHARKEYQPALETLQKTIFDDLPHNLAAKTVQAKCFFELGETELLEAHLEAMRKFIRRHRETGFLGERYWNFTEVLRRLALRKNLKTLPGDFEKMEVVAEKAWLAGWIQA